MIGVLHEAALLLGYTLLLAIAVSLIFTTALVIHNGLWLVRHRDDRPPVSPPAGGPVVGLRPRGRARG